MISKCEVDRWLVQNYEELATIVRGMCAKKNLVVYADDLISNTYIHISQLQFKSELDIRKAFINYAKKQLEWSDTQFYKQIFGKEKRFDSEIEIDFIEQPVDEDKLIEQEIFQKKIAAIEIYRLSLKTADEKKLFKLYFDQGLNTASKLHQHLTQVGNIISERTCSNIIAKIRQDIKQIYDCQKRSET